MRITGTFLDEISHDIPHQNWGREEWDADFRAMKAKMKKRNGRYSVRNIDFSVLSASFVSKPYFILTSILRFCIH